MDRFPFEKDLSLPDGDNPGDRHKSRRFSGAVGSNKGDDLPLGNLYAHALQRMDISVIGMDVVDI